MTGDELTEEMERHRRELRVHCYRMLGSVHDADDLVQETFVRAWRSADRFDPTVASLRTWLYRIATNACLSALGQRARRPLPSFVGPAFDDPDAPFAAAPEVPWLQPLPADPEASAVERHQLRTAFVAALQLLPPRQRAAVILKDALDVPVAEIAGLLDVTPAAVNSALQRARATLGALGDAGIGIDTVTESPAVQRAVVDRYVDAFVRADLTALAALLTDDVVLEMPPMRNWYVGVADYLGFMARVYRSRGTSWTTEPLWANGEAGFVARLDGDVHSVQLVTSDAGQVRRVTVYADPTVFDLFGLR